MGKTLDPRRMGGVARLYGERAAERLANTHVVVVGLGGVGSWTVEALVRSGVGQLTLVDGDCVEPSNTNRQLPAIDPEYGRPKAEVLAERCLRINPACDVRATVAFVKPDAPLSDLPESDWVVDCIDDVKAKVALCAALHRAGRRFVTTGGAAGKIDPAAVRVDDLARVEGDRLASKVRNDLRREYGFPKGAQKLGQSKPFGIPCVYSSELPRQPKIENNEAIGVAPGVRIGLGSGVVVTATAGLRAASVVINEIVAEVDAEITGMSTEHRMSGA